MDILNNHFNSTGKIEQMLFHPATGDILEFHNAVGMPVNNCNNTVPNDATKMNFLSNQVSVATRNLAVAEAKKNKEKGAYDKCKAKFFCNAKWNRDLYNSALRDWNELKPFVPQAAADLAKARKENAAAATKYNKCYSVYQVDLQRANKVAADKAAADAAAAATKAKIELDARKAKLKNDEAKLKHEEEMKDDPTVAIAKTDANNKNFIYIAISVGFIATLFFGYKIINK